MMFKKIICCVSLFAGFGLVGSQDDNSGVYELEMTPVVVQDVVVEQDIVLENQEYGSRFNYSGFRLPSTRYSGIELPECSENCVKYSCGAFTVAAVIGLTVGLSVAYKPTVTRIWNKGHSAILLHYRPGCSVIVHHGKSSSTYPIDCTRIINPGDHAKIFTSGNPTKLCAEYESWSKSGFECATVHSFTSRQQHVNDRLIFTRGQGDTAFNATSTENNSKNNETELDKMLPDWDPTQYRNLRGSVN